MPDDKTPMEDVSEAPTIDALLATSGELAAKSFSEHVALGQNALRRLVDPSSVDTTVADDYQKAIGLMTRDALFAVATLNRFFTLASKQDK